MSQTVVKFLKYILDADKVSGLFLTRDSSYKKSKIEKLLMFRYPLNAALFATFFISTLIITRFELTDVICCFSLFSAWITIYTIMTKLLMNKDKFQQLLKWCESLYDIETKFAVEVQEVTEAHLLKMKNRSLNVMKWIRIYGYGYTTLMTLGTAFIGLFLPETMYKKYNPPVPLYLPFKDRDNWLAFIITTAAQTELFWGGISFVISIFGSFFCIYIHICGFLDIINDTISEKLKPEILRRRKIVDDKQPKPSTSKLQLSVLVAINQQLTDKNVTSFNDWMSIVTKMIVDVNSIVTCLGELFTEVFLLFELACFGGLFIFGLFVIVIRSQYSIGIGFLDTIVYIYSFCYVNEKILEKFEDLKETLYDIPWYELTPKERKVLLIVLNSDEIQKGFTAAGIHSLTMERFWIIMEAGYSNILFTKDIVMK